MFGGVDNGKVDPSGARSKAPVCGHILTGIGVRIPPEACMSVFCERQIFLRPADHSSRGVLPNAVCLSVILKSRYCGDCGH